MGELCLKSDELCLDTVSTVRGSGWVNDQVYETLADQACLRRTHPLPRDGTDCIQVSKQLCLKSPKSFLDRVSTGSGSDLVSDQHATFPNDL